MSLLASGTLRVYLEAEGKSDEQIDALIEQYGGEVESALDHALEALATNLSKQFPKGMLSFSVEEG